jgi:hypothetical protein
MWYAGMKLVFQGAPCLGTTFVISFLWQTRLVASVVVERQYPFQLHNQHKRQHQSPHHTSPPLASPQHAIPLHPGQIYNYGAQTLSVRRNGMMICERRDGAYVSVIIIRRVLTLLIWLHGLDINQAC